MSQDGTDDEDCKKREDYNDPWAVWGRNRELADEEMNDSDDTMTASVQHTAEPVTALDDSVDDVNSVVSESASIDTIAGLPRGIEFD